MTAGKPIILGAFEMMNPSNGMPTWTHPEGRGDTWDSLDYWCGLAKTLDEGGFDFLFFADTYGYTTKDGRIVDEVAEHGLQFPALDPMVAIPAMAREAKRIGFVVTSPTTVERPYASARRFASIDRFTDGRIGWNVVTGSHQYTTDQLFGVTEQHPHDGRYDVADEFLDTAIRWLEGSWEDGAELRDRSANVYADPARLHDVDVVGRYERAHGVFAVPPTAQRTPVLFQAGTSDRGRAYAARNAEAVFIQGQEIATAKASVDDIRAKAAAFGRDPSGLAVVSGMTVVVGRTRAEAETKRAEYESLLTFQDAAVYFLGFTGLDLTGHSPDTRLAELGDMDQGQSMIDRYLKVNPDARITDILGQFRVKSTRGFQITGTPTEVADELELICDSCGLDGLMLEPTFGGPGVYEDFIELVMPIMRERGRMGLAPAGPTLRHRITGRARLADDHPAARFRVGSNPVESEVTA